MITIIIDNRETKLFNLLTERDLDIYKNTITIKKEQLNIGDIAIHFNHDGADYSHIYERKTVSDLQASIKDGRYKEQKARLKASNPTTINYLIEGDSITSVKNKNKQKMITSAYLNSIYRDGINVFFCEDANDSATFLLLVATKIIEKPTNFISGSGKSDNSDYIDICKIKTEKNKNIDKNTCYLLQLSQIPSISKEIAKNICSHYPSLMELMFALKETENKVELLMKIDKIGKTKAITIINFLC
jgi:crossover junction endonuclease MUS81